MQRESDVHGCIPGGIRPYAPRYTAVYLGVYGRILGVYGRILELYGRIPTMLRQLCGLEVCRMHCRTVVMGSILSSINPCHVWWVMRTMIWTTMRTTINCSNLPCGHP